MAKRTKMMRTTKTTTTRSKNGPTTTTTTMTNTTNRRINKRRAAAPPVTAKRTGNSGMIIAGIIVVLLLLGLGLAAYLSMGPTLTPMQQQSQFAGQLSAMQNDNSNLTLFYLSEAPNFQTHVNQSWSVQVTDQGYANSTIGQFTISWSGVSRSLSIQNGIVNTGISPTYAVTLPHSEFMSFSQAVISKNIAAGEAYYATYFLTGSLKYTRVN